MGHRTNGSRRVVRVRRLYASPLSDRLKLSRLLVRHCPPPVMSLVQEYSSGEEEGPVSPTTDAFGLASLPVAKKQRVETPKQTSVIPHSAPDVLSEVRNVSILP